MLGATEAMALRAGRRDGGRVEHQRKPTSLETITRSASGLFRVHICEPRDEKRSSGESEGRDGGAAGRRLDHG